MTNIKRKKVIVIGGGASGMLTAILCAQKYDVMIIEKNDKLGKKLLATGNGRCNITNLTGYDNAYNTDLSKYFAKFDYKTTLELFQKFGLLCFNDEQNRVYPISNASSSVLDILTYQINKNNIDVRVSQKVIDVLIKNNQYIVTTDDGNYICDYVVFSVGGNEMLSILNKLGAKTRQCNLSLVSLKTDNCKNLSGIRLQNVNVKLTFNNKVYVEMGEVLFKDSGLSGICIFNLSAILARCGDYNAKISIDLLPEYSIKQLKELLRKRINKNASHFLMGLFHYAINSEILKRANIDKNDESVLSSQQIDTIADIIKNFAFMTKGCYDNNQVVSGGVELSSLDDNLKLYNSNIFCTGEVCDVDGICGGYNLQWAWTSAQIVGSAICLN